VICLNGGWRILRAVTFSGALVEGTDHHHPPKTSRPWSNKNSGATTYTYKYDRFGNRWQQNGPHSSQLGFDANNRIVSGSGVAYDAAGNTINDGSTAYTYDAEGRITTAANNSSGTSTYLYDAEGRRVRKTTVAGGTVDFVYDLAGHEITEINSSGGWNRGEVYAGGRHLATYNNGTTYFIHADWLGTERARSNVAGGSSETCTSLPFGDWLTCSGGDPSPMHFTGKERDTESGLDNFTSRPGLKIIWVPARI
jgi:YD repeat-containing protein